MRLWQKAPVDDRGRPKHKVMLHGVTLKDVQKNADGTVCLRFTGMGDTVTTMELTPIESQILANRGVYTD